MANPIRSQISGFETFGGPPKRHHEEAAISSLDQVSIPFSLVTLEGTSKHMD